MNRVRCAIYTRKSSEEGLEQDFNSLHAQREACAAYVLSQASEGWVLNADEYDDGGISGGTLERPALQRLLDDVADGKVHIIVVYKVDRLTRSLLDFAKLVERFDKAGVSFVSITQSFNTTTSMGRLTLNMLLSFAQFEREVTAERIRDKIAASKAKGMWMGGTPPLGYAKNERSLRIVETEAAFVRDVFARYLELGTVRRLVEDLAARGITSPVRTLASGRQTGGGPLGRGQLYYLLSNPIYLGLIRHRDKTYPGLHLPIIDAATWDAVQARLADNTQGTERVRIHRPSLLAGLVQDEAGGALIASHASKAGSGKGVGGRVRYRYYISPPVHNGLTSNKPSTRIPARELENAVIMRLAAALADPVDLAVSLGADLSGLQRLAPAATRLREQLLAKDALTIRTLLAGVQVLRTEIRIDLDAAQLCRVLDLGESETSVITLTCLAKLSRSGLAMRLIQPNGLAIGETKPAANLIKLILKARGWWARLADGEIDIAALAREEGLTSSYITRVTRLAFLAPGVVEAILAGRQPARLEAGLLRAPGFAASWAEQEQVFLGA
jgi:site-specific DNA recombinase